MAAGPATISDSQTGPVEPRGKSPTRPAPEPSRVSPRATDDEILGLTTNVRQRGWPGVQAPPGAAGQAQDLEQLELDLASENRGRSGRTTDVPSSSAVAQDPNNSDSAETANAAKAEAAEAVTVASAAEPAHLKALFAADPELRAAWHDANAYRESFATPQEASAATRMLADLNRMDALFFSRRPEDHAQLARAVAELDPDAFASLVRAMTQVAQTAGATFPAISARSASAQHSTGQRSAPAAPSASARNATAFSVAPQGAQQAAVNATPAQEQFFHSTNAAAVEGVVEAIETQVERLLPDGISKSARNRVVGEIYRELDSTLRANRTLTQQMRDAFRSGALDASHQKAIVSLITGRARQALPGVAKRVLNEWTTTVVSANQQRRERQRTAERRVDIGGAGGAGNEGRHSMGPREINYARMSDADILNL
jgi:hypothetical protein